MTDTGPGVDRAFADRVFEPFVTTKHSGTGLGLAIVHRLLDVNNGAIAVDNPAGGGARFSVTLPASRTVGPGPITSDQAPQAPDAVAHDASTTTSRRRRHPRDGAVAVTPVTPTTRATDRRARRRVDALVLAPGASAGRDQPALVAIDDALSPAGVVVERIDFPYRLAGRRAPDKAPVLVRSVVEAAHRLADAHSVAPARVAFGGRSMGGRMCSMAVAEGLPAAALVLVSYPLHPPGKPERRRVEHLGDITVPCLFVSGTRDAFGTPDELQEATRAITGPVTHVWTEGGDHSLRGRDAQVAGVVAEWVLAL